MSNSSLRSAKPLFVVVLAPHVHTADATLDYYYDFSQSIAEFTRAFARLKMGWQWQPVTMQDFRHVIDAAAIIHADKTLLFFNLCDGDEINGVPGLSVIRYLEEKGAAYTGAAHRFYALSTSKISLKKAFDKAGVPTSPWFAITSSTFRLNGEFHHLPKPVLIKPAVSAGSFGLGVRNVVHTEEEVKALVQDLYNGVHGWQVAGGGFVAEAFIKGREFTCFLVGSGRDVFAYPPVEILFHQQLPDLEKFLSFDRLWEFYEGEKPMGNDEDFYNFFPVEAALAKEITTLSRKAYKAVGGTGYGRVDIRQDEASGKLYVLEVNAQCGLSEDENITSIGAVLRFAGEGYHTLLLRIIKNTLKQKAKRKAVVRQPTLFSSYLSL